MARKQETYSFNQVKEIIEKNEETIMNFFKMTVERLENKIDSLQKENTIMKHEMGEITKSINFQNKVFEKTVKTVKENDNKGVIEEKLAEIEDRSRRNNLRFDGIIEENGETWQMSEQKVVQVIKEKLDIETDIKIERAHRSGHLYRKDNSLNDRRTIVVKFLNFKERIMFWRRIERNNCGVRNCTSTRIFQPRPCKREKNFSNV